MTPTELTYRLHASPLFMEVANEMWLTHTLKNRLDWCSLWIESEQSLSKSNLGNDYVFTQEKDFAKVERLIAEFTPDVLHQKVLSSMFHGLWEIALEYINQIKIREGLL